MAITGGSEYAAKITVSLSQIRNMQRAQQDIWTEGFKNNNYSKLQSLLGTTATVLGLVFVASTPAGIVAGVTGLVVGLAPSAKNTLKNLVYNGYWEMGYLERFMEDNPKYDLMEVELPFIEYTVDGKRIRFVTGRGVIKRVHSGSGWITL
ncbi:hypothetical protein [Bacillus sp. NTK034]|uniref:hypothetical protein n=1 Tax=Bacillus sp. NTK034 TaxID=2802176 RepID=UPI001A8D9EC7|nr:hypothetical protein [Bacillus sp. NTK034]MBN8203902.1 hypothetical protein [Bacillus sp. NTK034]